MKNRDTYLNRLIELKDKSLIKVITGVRRCGKSSLLDLYTEYLLSHGVAPAAVVRMNFESLEFDAVRDYRQLNEYILRHIPDAPKTYVLLDEVQMVGEWERAVNSLRLDQRLDIYITGSNGHLLSSELSSLLAGRYIEIHMLPLSFREFLDFNAYSTAGDLQGYFNEYVEHGGLPGITELREHESAIRPYIAGIYSTIVMKDVIQRNEVRDPALLESVVRFMAGNVGSLVTSKKISDYLTSAGRKTSSETIDNYLRMLINAYVLYRAGRYDLKGKQQLKTQGKYYIVDTGIRGELVGRRGQDYGFVLENIVYFELLRRGFDVKIGSLAGQEVDFIATRPGQAVYYQVTATMLAEETRERELRPLRAIADNYEKVVLSMDRTPMADFDGIRSVNLISFLLE
ncbi:MAG: ATP-binding protein [Oscillospiraceae bacterium]|nr:ATP-binding protein [Oscillospiraceae bacterium]